MSDIQHGGISGAIEDRSIGGSATLVQRISGSVSPGGTGGRKEIISNTTEAWNSNPGLVSVKDIVYVYTDHTIVDGQAVPAIKIGDGVTYVVDLPFVGGDTAITQDQIDFWNDKVSAIIDPDDPENLILYTDQL